MKTKTELEHSIISVTTKINQKFPELTKYINELPVTNPNKEHPEINIKHLENYYDSLVQILVTYTSTHRGDL